MANADHTETTFVLSAKPAPHGAAEPFTGDIDEMDRGALAALIVRETQVAAAISRTAAGNLQQDPQDALALFRHIANLVDRVYFAFVAYQDQESAPEV